MLVSQKIAIIAALVSYLFGWSTAWCDSCGEMWAADQMCGGVCPICASLEEV